MYVYFILLPSVGSASAGSSSPYRAEERGARPAAHDGQLGGGEDPGGRAIQAQRGREGHPSRALRPEIYQHGEA